MYDDPPYERKGKVIPFVGIKFKVEQIFIIHWFINTIIKPEQEINTNKFFSLRIDIITL